MSAIRYAWDKIAAMLASGRSHTDLARFLERLGYGDLVGLNVGDGALVVDTEADEPLVHGVVWDDMQVNIREAGGVAALTDQAYRDTGANLLFWRHDQSDTLTVACQLSHRYKRDTDVRFHLHVVPMAPTGGNVVFDYAYARANVGEEIPALSGWTTGQASRAIAAGDQYQHRIVPIVTIPMIGAHESTIILVKIARNPAADTYDASAGGGGLAAANLGLLSMDFHFQIEKPGTLNEIPT
jgi:hypothetical protein